MLRIIQNLRIGTKLAITSALAILLVAGMIYLQMTGGAHVRRRQPAPRGSKPSRIAPRKRKRRSAACRSAYVTS